MTDTRGWVLRPFRIGDDEPLVRLWNRTLVRDPISVEIFRRQTLLDPNFQAEGCLLAEATNGGRELLGFVLATVPRVTRLFARRQGTGRIVGMGVVPEARGQGIGTALLDAAVAYLRQRACQRIDVAAHEYFAAGVDKQAYLNGIHFLCTRGFEEVRESVAMGRLLYDLSWPDPVRAAEARLLQEGIEVRYFEPADTYALVEYFRAEFPPNVEFFLRKLDARHAHDEMVVAVCRGEVLGYCQHLDSDHVGPFGVAAAHRNRGIGTVMLYRLLERMRKKGYKFAWFGETGRARAYYERADFTVMRVYAVLSRTLEQAGAGMEG
ncbi:MAG: GNAT family N-acetyltransferase [Chloroflexi bacterium]|nr:GNAT family N-acetyltransferase [Chloroflexota bacterium]